MCRLLKTSKCKLIPVQFLPTNITALENISSTNITAQGKYFFPTNITALGKYFIVFRLPAAPPQQGSGSQPLAPYFNAMDSINWKPTLIQHKLFFLSFSLFEQLIRVLPLTSDESPDWDVIAWWQSSNTGSVWMAGVILAALSPVPP